jgi:hypothetical protein
MDVDTTQLRAWSATLNRAADECPEEAKKVVGKGCNNIKKDWQRRWTGLSHAPALPYAISYDVTQAGDVITGEVGPDKNKRQGALGNLIEFGSINNPPHPGGAPALDAEGPRFERALADLGVDLLGET